jgi:hypothetical protein
MRTVKNQRLVGIRINDQITVEYYLLLLAIKNQKISLLIQEI